ncbi:MAG: sulfurtransferase TusA family protein [Gammaproteobacteria bacterium]|nr:sulfurtransferase TusA family protein [Gammaproteobacteria bacterium]
MIPPTRTITRVDARRLLCPMPVIRLQSAAKGQPQGTEIEVLATDPGVMADIPAWCRVHGHAVTAQTTLGREILIRVRLGPTS